MKLLLLMPTKYLGNLVISLQTMATIVAHYGYDQVVLVIDDGFEDLVRHCLGPDLRLLAYPRKGISSGNIFPRLRRYIAFLVRLHRHAADTLLDLDGTVISGRLTTFSRAREKVGPGFAKHHHPYTRLIPNDRDTQHCFEDFAVMARAIGIDVTPENYLIIPTIEGNNPDELPFYPDPVKPIACIHPSATKDYKQWDIYRFAQLADQLMASGWQVIIIGAGAHERIRIDRMLQAMHSSPVDTHDKLNLLQLTWLLQRATTFIGNDSGPMHLAAASGTQVIALFGPTELSRWQPKTDKAVVIKGAEPCSTACKPEACLNAYQCLTSLTVDQVIKTIAFTDTP
ncbi:MAG: glycosyltransferase family 9 protein [Pseudohongiellaceae bacterium]